MSSRSNRINKAPPFLELSRDTIQNFDTSGLDLENVLSVWTGLTKCSGFIKSGKRLENISWRIVNRNLINQQNQQIPKGVDNNNNNTTQQRNKLNDGDFLSLLSIVTDQNLITQPRPQLIKKKSSNQKMARNASRNSNRSVESLDKLRPGMIPRKSSSSKSLKKLNQRTRRSNADLPNLNRVYSNTSTTSDTNEQPVPIKVEHDSDLFEQPNPKYAFGVQAQRNISSNDDENNSSSSNFSNEKPQAPPLTRSDTSTSIVRGFSPSHISVAQLSTNSSPGKPSTSTKKAEKTSAPSLFDQSNLKNPQPRKAVPKNSLFNHPQPQQQQPHHNIQRIDTQTGVPLERVKSPLSQETTNEVLKPKEPNRSTSLFQQPQKSKPKTGTLFDHSALQENNNNVKSSLFEQVGISPEIKRQPTPQQHKKRTNVLNNLGMTSLAVKEHQPQRKDKNNMFFIESSPSPTDGPKYIDSQQQAQSHQNHHHHHHHHQQQRQRSSSFEKKRNNNNLSSSSVNDNNNNKSLFSGKSEPIPKEIIFSSDDSLSDESDWSSVSDSEGSDEFDENDLTKEWKQASFKRDEPLPKPQIKRSLLSGLFLNEMQHEHHHQHHQDHSNSQIQSRSTSGVTTPQPWKSGYQHGDHSSAINLGANNNATGSQADLGTSISSSNIVVKHRHRPQSIHGGNNSNDAASNSITGDNTNNNNNDALELSSTTPHTVISTSNINVSGQVSEPQDHHDSQGKLKEKLTGTQEAQNNLQTSSSFTQMISRSAVNLTNYFAAHRKNSFSSIASDRTRTRFKHESNAPATASTLLPTALSTHMFLPNAHQRKSTRSKLASVLEAESGNTSSNEPSRKNSEAEESNVNTKIELPMKSPTVPITTNKPSHNVEIEGLTNGSNGANHIEGAMETSANFNISRKLSPKTTRRQMLATELSDSLRKSILWDRKNGVPNNHHHHHHHHHHHQKQNNDNNEGEESKEEQPDVKETVDGSKQPKVIKSTIENFNNDEWDTAETDFYTRGW